jgi:hypothetical protein
MAGERNSARRLIFHSQPEVNIMTRKTNLTHLIITTVAAAMLILPPAARADIVDTQDLAAQTQTEQDRAKVQSFVERATVKEKLEAMGVDGLLAKDRVAALSEQEVHALAERIDAMPAGGTLSQMDMVVILLIAILVAVAL